jgi:hypothetical protein
MTDRPAGRVIEVDVVDRNNRRAVGADVAFLINGRFAGQLLVGSNRSGPVTFEVRNPFVTVEVRASLLGQVRTATVGPHERRATLVFDNVPRFAAGVDSRATCPDGSSGSPCVECSEDGDSWRMCG